LAEAWSALGTIKAYYDWEWEDAEQAYLKANALNPSLPWNHYHYSWYLNLFGRMDEAIREHKKAKELDPFEPFHTAFLGMIYFMVGEYDKAIREAKLAIAMKNKYLGKTILAKTYITMGRMDEANEIYQQLMNEYPRPKHYYYFLGVDYVLSGKIEEARKILSDMDTKYDTIPNSWGAWQRTEIYTALGDYDNSFEWFQFEPHHHFVPYIRVNWPLLTKDSAFIRDPRFKELMRRFNLPDPAPYQYDPDLDK
jgi:tetratricopeptide (TPR) repeat protein